MVPGLAKLYRAQHLLSSYRAEGNRRYRQLALIQGLIEHFNASDDRFWVS